MEKYDVLAIGELNVDMIVTGLKTLPELGKEILANDCSIVLGSSTAICAVGIARLGLHTGIIGKLGRDSFAEVVLEALRYNGIDTQNVIIDENIKTGITISLSIAADRALVTFMGSIGELGFKDINLKLLECTRHIHVGSYFLQNKLRPHLAMLFQNARNAGVTTSLDAGWDDTGVWDYDIFEVLNYTDIFFPNETEALNIAKCDNVQDAADILSGYARTVVVKCGPKGAIAKSGERRIIQETFDANVVDTTGAGDSFNAGFIYGFLNQYSLEKCMTYGNACGSISVTKIGGATSCPSLNEVEVMIIDKGNSTSDI